jgi:hypothetical protein
MDKNLINKLPQSNERLYIIWLFHLQIKTKLAMSTYSNDILAETTESVCEIVTILESCDKPI